MKKIIVVLALATAAVAQESRADLAFQGTILFTKGSIATNGDGNYVTRQVDNTGGFLLSYRYHFTRWLAAEGNYGRANDTLGFTTSALQSFGGNVTMHQLTGGAILGLPTGAHSRFSPYVIAEGGAFVFSPGSNGLGAFPVAVRQTKGGFVYGGGADFPLVKHFSLRAEYRGLLYHAPDFGVSALTTGTLAHTAQPSAGLVLRF